MLVERYFLMFLFIYLLFSLPRPKQYIARKDFVFFETNLLEVNKEFLCSYKL